jgi:hypothetical protein
MVFLMAGVGCAKPKIVIFFSEKDEHIGNLVQPPKL